MPKRKASAMASPQIMADASALGITKPISAIHSTSNVSRDVKASLGRRSSTRSIPRKSYADIDANHIDGIDVFEDLADREASPDQASEFEDEHIEEEEADVDHEDDNLSLSAADHESDDSIAKPKASRTRKPISKKQESIVRKDGNLQESLKEEKETGIKAEEEEPQYDSDGELIVPKGPTKADKHRARDARAAERYADFPPRPPAINSDYVPVPFKGRLGYACLNTILRSRKEPVFCSRTTRIATIAKEDHGMPFVLELGRKNAEDLSKVLEWNEKYGIRFFRLSSEMFPFASHPDYLYNLEHADAELRAAGAVANKYDHRITCHPGQFTQIASPNPKVFENAVRDLEFHNELLTRMRLDPQRDRDAVMILHLGGAYGDKEATLQRFRDNYAKLSIPVKRRLVLENDDMSWSVTDLLPLCQELDIPLVLDWHHHNVVHDEEKFREGTLDIMPLLPAIAETWSRKNIKQKMHTSEPKLPNHPLASQRRSHSNRVYHLPPCPNDMDLMIESKDKEQAVFELSKTYNLNNPPLPPIVVGDGPGAKGDEAYWPEGQEILLKTTRSRVKKEPEYDSEGNEVKPKPKKKLKKEPQFDEDGNEIKPTPRKRVKKETKEDIQDNDDKDDLESLPKPKRASKKKAKTVAADDVQAEEDTESQRTSSTEALVTSSELNDVKLEAEDDMPAPKRRAPVRRKGDTQAQDSVMEADGPPPKNRTRKISLQVKSEPDDNDGLSRPVEEEHKPPALLRRRSTIRSEESNLDPSEAAKPAVPSLPRRTSRSSSRTLQHSATM